MIKGEYTCLECGEFFENQTATIKHSMETKHARFELIGTDIRINIKA